MTHSESNICTDLLTARSEERRVGKESETLSTVRRNNLAEEDVTCFQSDLSDCKDKLEWSSCSLPATPAGCSSLLSPIFDNFSFAFFRNPARDFRKLMSLQDRYR